MFTAMDTNSSAAHLAPVIVTLCIALLASNSVAQSVTSSDLDQQALELARSLLEKEFVKCGDPYFSSHTFQGEMSVEEYRNEQGGNPFKALRVVQQTSPADRANGFQWRGYAELDYAKNTIFRRGPCKKCEFADTIEGQKVTGWWLVKKANAAWTSYGGATFYGDSYVETSGSFLQSAFPPDAPK